LNWSRIKAMPMSGKKITCDLIVIGSGMAGMAASLFAANRGIDVLQVGVTGEINFASGLIDLLGVHPVERQRVRKNPWTAMAELVRDVPSHPYARLRPDQIEQALDEFLLFLKNAGQAYAIRPQQNTRVLTPVGTIKTTYAVPQSMAHVHTALENQQACLLVDVARLKGFSGRQIVENMTDRWPALRTARIEFPDTKGELYPEKMAWALESTNTRAELIDRIRPHLGNAQCIGLPAVLGIYRTAEVLQDLQKSLGVPVFEVPTMLPAVTGLRLREAFEQGLPRIGVRTWYQHRIDAVTIGADQTFHFYLGSGSGAGTVVIKALAAILATGRFYGKGLNADRSRIRETLFNLPVYQPQNRTLWHHKDFLHPAGHLINQSGLQIDDHFRPVDHNRKTVHPNLFAAGSVLAHQDWIRQKCGSGLAIASAFGAVSGYLVNCS
jgi:glycerol-3-phosphate dehydrogenase subunit B